MQGENNRIKRHFNKQATDCNIMLLTGISSTNKQIIINRQAINWNFRSRDRLKQ